MMARLTLQGNSKVGRLIGTALASLLAAALALLFWLPAHPRQRAEAFLRDLQSLEVGEATFEQAQQLAQRHAGSVPRRAPQCTADRCEFDFFFENRLLSCLHLSPTTVLGATIKVQDGRVWYVGGSLTSG